MNLHSNRELLKDAILATAQYMGIKEIYVEKDYWVTVALYAIFHSDVAHYSIFKGGTALSKCHKLTERFSEDIDIVIIQDKEENDNQLKKKIRAISKVVSKLIPELEVEGLTNKKGNIRKTVHHYTKIFRGEFGSVNDKVLVEATWLGNFEPFTEMQVDCYIYEMMNAQGHKELIEQYNMSPFNIKVLSKLRTFCEKIMSLVRFSRSKEPIFDLKNKIRHIYDIHLMLKDKEVRYFFESKDFQDMLINVANDDIVSYRNNNAWILEHPSTALIFEKPQETWEKLRMQYNSNFKDLVIGKLPKEKNLIETLIAIADRLKKINWELK